MELKKVLITGILGQDGANMAEYLLSLDEPIQVYGMMRRSSNLNETNILSFKDNPRLSLVYGDLTDEISIDRLVQDIKPDYFINFAANSFVGCSWDMPLQVFDVNTLGVIRSLEAIRKFKPNCRFYSAGSSEEFGDVDYSPQDINHPIKPRSPYGASKASARHIVKVYRESYGLYAMHSILFNHEGLRRGEEFVTRKITKAVAKIATAIANNEDFKSIKLGNVNARRDWSDSEDFVKAVWLMLNQEEPKEYVLSSNETHSIKEFVEKAFGHAYITGSWHGENLDEKFLHEGNNVPLVEISEDFYRPAEVELLYGDSNPARTELNWQPEISFDNLVQRMVEYDLELEHAKR
jgi:GDPmannose 4,6-dehydratase|tara:strand:+ start:224 stop:1273 length:1050 start_codon:yes stop_codon:yes gene_type:complete